MGGASEGLAAHPVVPAVRHELLQDPEPREGPRQLEQTLQRHKRRMLHVRLRGCGATEGAPVTHGGQTHCSVPRQLHGRALTTGQFAIASMSILRDPVIARGEGPSSAPAAPAPLRRLLAAATA